MLRIIACVLAGALALLPASAQTQQRSEAHTQSTSNVQTATFSATTFHGEPTVQPNRSHVSDAATRPARSHGGAFAAAVFRVLSSQNTITLTEASASEMDAVLRYPEPSSGSVPLFREAKKLYDTATSYKTDTAVLNVDLLSLRCRLSINIGSK